MTNDGSVGHPHDRLSACLDGELGPAERVEIESHLERCEGCRVLLEDLRIISSGIASEATPAPPADLAARIIRRLGPLSGEAKVIPMRPQIWRSPLMVGSMAAALVGIIATAVWLSFPPPSTSRQERVVMAPPPAREPIREAGSDPGDGSLSDSKPLESDRADRAAGGDQPAPQGEPQLKDAPDSVARPEPSPLAPPPAELRDPTGREQAAAEPVRVAGNERSEASDLVSGQSSAPPSDYAARRSTDSRGAGEDAGSRRAREGVAAASPPESGASRDRALELLSSDYHAVLSENGSLSFRAGRFECLIPAGEAAGKAATPAEIQGFAGAPDPETEIEELFALAAEARSQSDAATGTGVETPGALLSARLMPPMILTMREGEESRNLADERAFRKGPDAAAQTAPIAARLDRLIRTHYLPLMPELCGSLPEGLQPEDPAPPE